MIALLNADTSAARQRDWSGVESELRVRLPGDYKEFIEQTGGGQVDGYLYILAPASCRGAPPTTASGFFGGPCLARSPPTTPCWSTKHVVNAGSSMRWDSPSTWPR
ncbi:SMI1/KNR4 family protein [Streptomyces sp. NPDC002962]|uniref:SMI1/KNR4 family protein n=1 Tax=Streptomyces sp. NPDC002962 TaxID=3364674 RepID=UPI00369B7369